MPSLNLNRQGTAIHVHVELWIYIYTFGFNKTYSSDSIYIYILNWDVTFIHTDSIRIYNICYVDKFTYLHIESIFKVYRIKQYTFGRTIHWRSSCSWIHYIIMNNSLALIVISNVLNIFVSAIVLFRDVGRVTICCSVLWKWWESCEKAF